MIGANEIKVQKQSKNVWTGKFYIKTLVVKILLSNNFLWLEIIKTFNAFTFLELFIIAFNFLNHSSALVFALILSQIFNNPTTQW